jgi:hypothetical protein
MAMDGRIVASVVGLCAAAASAQAQVAAPGPDPLREAPAPERQSVGERARPDYDALGIRLGSFIVHPAISVQELYDTNIFATQSGTASDFITSIQPSLQVASDWNVHAVGLSVSGDVREYLHHDTESNDNFAIAGSGRLDIQRGHYLSGGAGYQLLHEDRGSPDDRGGREPTEFHVTSANLSYVYEPYRIGLRLDTTVDSYDYNDVATGTGAIIDNDVRDRIVYAVAPRATYEILPGYRAFARTTFNWRKYNSTLDAAGVNRNSNGYQFDIGTALDLGGIITGEVYAGYLVQDYDDPRFSSSSSVAFGGNLLWNVTQLTSIRAALARTVEETVLAGESSYIQTAVRLSVEHELLRNVLLTAAGAYINSDYQGGGARTDDYYEFGGGGRYLLNRLLSVGFDVTYRTRSSDVAGNDYDRMIIAARLRAQF